MPFGFASLPAQHKPLGKDEIERIKSSEIPSDSGKFLCITCGFWFQRKHEFCPNCLARYSVYTEKAIKAKGDELRRRTVQLIPFLGGEVYIRGGISEDEFEDYDGLENPVPDNPVD